MTGRKTEKFCCFLAARAILKKYGKIVQRTAAVILCSSTAKELLRPLVRVIGQRCGTGAEKMCCFAFRHGGHQFGSGLAALGKIGKELLSDAAEILCIALHQKPIYLDQGDGWSGPVCGIYFGHVQKKHFDLLAERKLGGILPEGYGIKKVVVLWEQQVEQHHTGAVNVGSAGNEFTAANDFRGYMVSGTADGEEISVGPCAKWPG